MLLASRRAAIQCACCLLAVWSCTAAARAQAVDPTEASLRILSRSVNVQRDGSHLSLLFALRQLHDPDLKPFFAQLLDSAHWQLQVHAALALGEIDPEQQIDPALLDKLAPNAQDAVVATALDLNLLPPRNIAQALKSAELHAMARLVLLAEVVAPPLDAASPAPAADMPDLARQLLALTESEDDHVAGLASCLLAQSGEAKALAAYRARMARLDSLRALDLQLWLLDAIRRYRLSACLPWVKEWLALPSADAELSSRAVFTLLDLEPEAGLAAWTKLLGAAPSYQQRVKYCTLLLAARTPTPAAAYDRLASNPPNPDEELIARMIAVGKAISDSGDVAAALIQLLELGHLKMNDWAMDHASKLPGPESARVYANLLDRVILDKPGGDAISLAVAATPKLFAIEPEQVLSRLRAAEDDGVQQQAILLGLFEADAPEVGAAAASLRRIGSGRADSLALLLMARHTSALEKPAVDQLGKIAAGGGGLSEVLQVQAAWLFLKHTGQTQKALNQLFANRK